jgi:hypothetical protein
MQKSEKRWAENFNPAAYAAKSPGKLSDNAI